MLAPLAMAAALWPGRMAAQLADSSPFVPAGAAEGSAGGGPSNEVELRGIMVTPQGTQFNIYDPVRKTGTWASVNERMPGFVIRSADLSRNAVMVQAGGRTLRLVLKLSKTEAMGPGIPAMRAGAMAGGRSPADEAAALAAVAEEVRRRRQLRDEAAAQAQREGASAPAAVGQRSRGPGAGAANPGP